MTSKRERYARLERMDVWTEATVAAMAAGYFSPLAIGKRKRRDGGANGGLTPARSSDFVGFLEEKGALPEPQKYIYQIRDLLARMERDNILVSFPSYTPDVMLPKSYYALHEHSELRRRGLLWLAKTLGGGSYTRRCLPQLSTSSERTISAKAAASFSDRAMCSRAVT